MLSPGSKRGSELVVSEPAEEGLGLGTYPTTLYQSFYNKLIHLSDCYRRPHFVATVALTFIQCRPLSQPHRYPHVDGDNLLPVQWYTHINSRIPWRAHPSFKLELLKLSVQISILYEVQQYSQVRGFWVSLSPF